MDHPIRPYDEDRDLDAVLRMWLEIGWVDDAAKREALRTLLAAGRCEVAEMGGEAECLVHWVPGSIRYQDEALPLCAITAVTTSHVGRKQGFASTLTARAVEQAAAEGCAVAALGMFEQGFYDRLGFGTAAYDHQLSFDPAALQVLHVPYRAPVRLTTEHAADIQVAMARRLQAHGSVVLDPPDVVLGEMGLATNPTAIGYRDGDGELTHFVYGPIDGEYGPWRIDAIAYRTTDQLLELLRLLRELGDQIRSVKLIEPAHVQLQVLLRSPMRERERTLRSSHESGNRAIAWWQLRIVDLEACVAARRWPGPEVAFNLVLTDPIEGWTTGSGWRGLSGEYTVRIGASSKASAGVTHGLPTLTAGLAGFSRLWFAVRPATTLAVTDDLHGPSDLLADLDEALRLPPPLPGWEF